MEHTVAPQEAPQEAAQDPSEPSGLQVAADDALKGGAKRNPASGKPRAIKTPIQKEALEAAFKIHQFPSEEVRKALGARIELTEQQVQVWFSHRRRREKKTEGHTSDAFPTTPGNQTPEEPSSPNLTPSSPKLTSGDLEEDGHAEGGSFRAAAPPRTPADSGLSGGTAPGRPENPCSAAPSSSHQPHTSGFESDSQPPPRKPSPLPNPTTSDQDPGAHPQTSNVAATAAAANGSAPTSHVTARIKIKPPSQLPSPVLPSPVLPEDQGDDEGAQESEEEEEGIPDQELQELLALAKARMTVPYLENGPALAFFFDRRPKAVSAEPGTGQVGNKSKRVHLGDYEVEATDGTFHATKRRNLGPSPGQVSRSDRMRVDGRFGAESDREAKKERRRFEAAEKEAKRAEVQRLKEVDRMRSAMQKEAKRQEAAAEKEKRAEERKRQAEDKKKEKEMLKALAAQEKEVLRMRQREAQSGPRDDLEIEWQALLDAQRTSEEYQDVPEDQIPPPKRPPFPPTEIRLHPAFPPEVEPHAGELLHLWSFLQSFAEVLGLNAMALEELVGALLGPSCGRSLGRLHIALLRILQADMEESHATGAMQSGGAANFIDHAIKQSAQCLEEAWAWGLDVDAWRAHLNPLTWPEVMRQWAIAAGHGRRRPRPRKEAKATLGTEGEDTAVDAEGNLILRLPARFGPTTVKGAAWQVLSTEGANGLNIAEIARRMKESGLRDLSTSKTPEASVVAALSRDSVFCRVAPGKYALQAIVNQHAKAPATQQAAQPSTADGGGIAQENALGTSGKADPAGEEDELMSATAQRARQQQRAETVRRAEELNAARGEPVGQDRRHNKYWRFCLESQPGGDPELGRLYIESAEDGSFRVLTDAGELQKLMEALERRGAREERLFAELLRQQDSLTQSMPCRPFRMPEQQIQKAASLRGSEEAPWTDSVALFASEHLPADSDAMEEDEASEDEEEASSPFEASFKKLKGGLQKVEQALPRAALASSWDGDFWQEQVSNARSLAELRSLLGHLEEAIQDGWLSPLFQRSPLLVKGAWLLTGKEVASAVPGSNGEVQQIAGRLHTASVDPQRPTSPARSLSPQPGPQPLAWLPPTSAALALRLHALDAALIYEAGGQPVRDSLMGYSYVQRPALTSAAVAIAGPTNNHQLQHGNDEKHVPAARVASCAAVSGMPVGLRGRERKSTFPAFPQAALRGPPKPFCFPVDEYASVVGAAMANGTILTAAAPAFQPQLKAAARPPTYQGGQGKLASAAKGFRSARAGPGGVQQQHQGWGQAEAMDVDSRASTGVGMTDDEDEAPHSRAHVGWNATGLSDDDLDEMVPAFNEGDAVISDSD
ncbi:hypothetical protein WJX73_004705 [Symbiochloris irregularis]|uniref:Uncharacterized protein n=1 Tax=Symbiochloris irregularis TaxID=706552 RepID=A0AAW1NU14_9CHLO